MILMERYQLITATRARCLLDPVYIKEIAHYDMVQAKRVVTYCGPLKPSKNKYENCFQSLSPPSGRD